MCALASLLCIFSQVPGLSQSHTSARTSSTSFILSRAVIEDIRLINSASGFVYLQLVNKAYTNMTLSWICNVERFSVLDKTVFIATDLVSFQTLSKWAPHVFLRERDQSPDLSYGQAAYYEMISFRSKIVEELLHSEVSVWLVESDSVWLADPLPHLQSVHGMDVVAGQDGTFSDEIPEAGFIFLNATFRTKRLWSDLRQQHDQALAQMSEAADLGDAGSEMLMLPGHLGKVRWTFFPKINFVSGLWYTNEDMKALAKPVVIQNNWIVGNKAKTERAKKFGHWFLTESTTACVEK